MFLRFLHASTCSSNPSFYTASQCLFPFTPILLLVDIYMSPSSRELLQGMKLEEELLAVRNVPFWNDQMLPILFLKVIVAVYVVTSNFYKYI